MHGNLGGFPNPVLEAALVTRVLSYEHPELIERLKRELRLTVADAQALFEDLKRFLALCGLRPDGEFVPTPTIDAAWHNFILYTRDYAAFCDEMFGQFLHHRPKSYFTTETHEQEFAETLVFAGKVFGELGSNWELEAAHAEHACAKPYGRLTSASSALKPRGS